jgi:predicted Zn-dependent peptidase
MRAVDRTRLPTVEPSRDFEFPSARTTELSNGLSVRTVERRGLPVVTCMLLLPVGSAFDPGEQPGLAALTADLLDESSDGRSTLEIHAALDDIGAHFDVDIGADATRLTLTTLSRFSEQALRLMAGMVARPGFQDSDFERVRELRLHRLLQLRDQPGAIADRAFTRVVYGDHPYGHLSIGTAASLERLSRRDVERFHRRQYVPQIAALLIVGDGTHVELVRQAAHAFEPWPRGADTGRSWTDLDLSIEEPARDGANRLFVADRPGAAQSELRIGHLGVSRSTPDFHALLVLNAVLGGQFVSRINANLREDKGYTYGARSAFDFRRGRGSFVVQTSVAANATGSAVGEVLAELQAILGDRPPTDAELDLAKASLTRGFPRGFETTEQVARGLAQIVLYGLPADYFTRFGQVVNAITAEEVRAAAAARLSPDRTVVIVVGDRARIDADLATLALGRLHELPAV